MSPVILVTPEDSLVHENVSIVVNGLEYQKNYLLELRLLHKVGIYRSYGVFKSTVTGCIDLSKIAPIRGTYSGVNESGLFESLEPTDTVRYGGYCNCTPPVDFKYQLLVKNLNGTVLGEKSLCRRLMHPLVERIEVEEAYPEGTTGKPKVTGTMFKPPGNGPFPTIIDISGTGGGLNEQKGAALASRGFAVLCLAFFKYKDLPYELQEVELRYFEDAINFVTSLPYTNDRIGFQGISFGGTLVMFLTTRFKQIKAACSINGSFTMDEFAHVLIDGKQPPVGRFINQGIEDIWYLNDLMVYTDMVRNLKLEDGAGFKFEDSSPETAFRFSLAVDDLSTPTVFVGKVLSEKLRNLNRKVEVHYVSGGHLLDPPCFPHHEAVFSAFAGTFQAYGGETSLHGKSQFEVWEKTVQFFSEHLGAPTPLPDYSRHLAKL